MSGKIIALSILFSFSVQAQPSVPSTITYRNFPINFVWFYSDSNQSSKDSSIFYTHVLALDSLCTQVLTLDSMIADHYNGRTRQYPDTTRYAVTNQNSYVYGVWLWWKVQARYPSGGRSAWSPVWKFKVGYPIMLTIVPPTPYPNPTTDSIRVPYYNVSWGDTVTLTLLNIIGTTVVQNKLVPPIGTYLASVHLETLPAGNYFLKVESGPYSQTYQLVKR